MKIAKTASFIESYIKLPKQIQKKADKQIKFLLQDLFYPSLYTKKMEGRTNTWEVRVDRSYRMTFEKDQDTLILRTVGPHDEGLGKK